MLRLLIATSIAFTAITLASDCAVVESLTGAITVSHGAGPPVQAALFDWIRCEATVETGPNGSAVIAHASGQRMKLGPRSKITVGNDSSVRVRGMVEQLTAATPTPKLAALASEYKATAVGAIRVRGPEPIRDLFPKAGFYANPARATLKFSPAEGHAEYEVTVEDDELKQAFKGKTTTGTIEIGALKPGTHYNWTVQTVGTGRKMTGEAEFETVTLENAGPRNQLAERAAKDPELLTLLALVDVRLGLLAEAESELMSVKKRSAQQEDLLTKIRRDMADPPLEK